MKKRGREGGSAEGEVRVNIPECFRTNTSACILTHLLFASSPFLLSPSSISRKQLLPRYHQPRPAHAEEGRRVLRLLLEGGRADRQEGWGERMILDV